MALKIALKSHYGDHRDHYVALHSLTGDLVAGGQARAVFDVYASSEAKEGGEGPVPGQHPVEVSFVIKNVGAVVQEAHDAVRAIDNTSAPRETRDYYRDQLAKVTAEHDDHVATLADLEGCDHEAKVKTANAALDDAEAALAALGKKAKKEAVDEAEKAVEAAKRSHDQAVAEYHEVEDAKRHATSRRDQLANVRDSHKRDLETFEGRLADAQAERDRFAAAQDID